MDLQSFLQRREAIRLAQRRHRNLCVRCMQPQFGCFCVHIRKFDPHIKFIILIHPIELKRRIATGRMAHLCLENSELLVGHDYTDNARVNELIANTKYQPAVLYPGRMSLNLSSLSAPEKASLFASQNTPLLFVIDGTWATARKTMHLSKNLRKLPRLSFTPPSQSQFLVRKQPAAECLSTIEAIYQLIGQLGSRPGFDVSEKKHESLIYVFKKMVDRQLDFIKTFEMTQQYTYRRPRMLE